MAKLVPFMLGSIEFSLTEGAMNDLERGTSWRIDQPDPLEGLGVPVVRGRESDEITLQGVVFPGIAGKLSSVNRLRDAGDAGEPLMLVDGEGTVYGQFVVKHVRERQTAHQATGLPRRMEWTLTLVAYPDEIEVSL